jgi:hypothetical protein
VIGCPAGALDDGVDQCFVCHACPRYPATTRAAICASVSMFSTVRSVSGM